MHKSIALVDGFYDKIEAGQTYLLEYENNVYDLPIYVDDIDMSAIGDILTFDGSTKINSCIDAAELNKKSISNNTWFLILLKCDKKVFVGYRCGRGGIRYDMFIPERNYVEYYYTSVHDSADKYLTTVGKKESTNNSKQRTYNFHEFTDRWLINNKKTLTELCSKLLSS